MKEVADLVIGFSSDEKNCSMEFNEFLKMMATEERKDSQPKEEALLEAFRFCFNKFHFFHFLIFVAGLLTEMVVGNSILRSSSRS